MSLIIKKGEKKEIHRYVPKTLISVSLLGNKITEPMIKKLSENNEKTHESVKEKTENREKLFSIGMLLVLRAYRNQAGNFD